MTELLAVTGRILPMTLAQAAAGPTLTRILTAGLLALVASASLNIGAAIGLYARPPQTVVAGVMAFGAGALIEALAVELAFQGVEDLVRTYAVPALEAWVYIALGFVIGGAIYFVADRVLEGGGGALRKPALAKRYLDRTRHRWVELLHRLHAEHWLHVTTHGPETSITHGPERLQAIEHAALVPAAAQSHGNNVGRAMFLGAVLDGIPSSIIIGAQFTALAAFSPSFLIAVFIANLPQAMSSANGMRLAGISAARIFGLWTMLTLASGAAGMLGNGFLADAPPTLTTFVEAVGGGGVLAMLAASMMPEAFEEGGPWVGFLTIAGFLAAFFFTALKLG